MTRGNFFLADSTSAQKQYEKCGDRLSLKNEGKRKTSRGSFLRSTPVGKDHTVIDGDATQRDAHYYFSTNDHSQCPIIRLVGLISTFGGRRKV